MPLAARRVENAPLFVVMFKFLRMEREAARDDPSMEGSPSYTTGRSVG